MATTMKLPKKLRGKYVTRAAFAKMQAEKQRLYRDMETIVRGGYEGIRVRMKWKKHFTQWDDIRGQLGRILKAQLEKQPTSINK